MTLQGVLASSTVAAIFYFAARTHRALPHIRQKIFYSRSTVKLAGEKEQGLGGCL